MANSHSVSREDVHERTVDPVGQYRDRVGLNVEMVYLKVVKKS